MTARGGWRPRPGPPAPAFPEPALRYTELANTLVKRITEGQYEIGDQLPNELALAAQFQSSRSTVRAALDIVEGLGLVTRKRRSGTVVCSRTTNNQYTKSVHTIEDLVNYASHTERQILEVSPVVADEALAQALECKPGTTWLRVRMLRVEKDAAHTPLCWNDAYMLPDVGQRIVGKIPNGSGLLCRIIESEAGIAVADIKQSIGATAIDGEMASRLGVAPGTPGLEITRLYVDRANTPFLITVNTYSAHKFRFTFWMHRSDSH
ncbi:GntR family transcriptional regulator [Bordetella bronchiseptica]|nr:GntR family transcriptional regulator [Bordetella bronchiseptica]AZW42310.1 GntR family transcriptional regulator [Bordetella bronchiseptica]